MRSSQTHSKYRATNKVLTVGLMDGKTEEEGFNDGLCDGFEEGSLDGSIDA